MNPIELSNEQMLADLTATFPTLKLRPLPTFGQMYAHRNAGFWTFADHSHVMPDGRPIFRGAWHDPEGYDGHVHAGFLAWLGARGWYYDCYDTGTYFIVPNSYFGGSSKRRGPAASPAADFDPEDAPL